MFVGAFPIFLFHSFLPLLVHISAIWQQICCLPSSFYPSWRLTLSHPVNTASCQPRWRSECSHPGTTCSDSTNPTGSIWSWCCCPSTILLWSPGPGGRAESRVGAKQLIPLGFSRLHLGTHQFPSSHISSSNVYSSYQIHYKCCAHHVFFPILVTSCYSFCI